MVLMERIVRPHLPLDSNPAPTAPKCQQDEPNKVVKLAAPNNAGGTPKKPTEKTRTSSWSHSYKKYMTKKEKEQKDCKDQKESVVGTAGVTDRPAGGASTSPAA
jgi:hypothetical protein